MPKDIRLHKGDLQTAYHQYTHRYTGRTIGIIGAVHIGDASYYRTINGLLTLAEQFREEIHYEGVRNDAGLEANRAEEHPYTVVAKIAGMESQADAIQPKKSWRNTDLTTGQIIRAARRPKRMRAWLQRVFTMPVPDVPKGHEASFRHTTRWMLRHMLILPGTRYLMGRNARRVILDARNRYVIGRVLRRQADATLLWGAAHQKGMRRILQRNDFRLTDTIWLTAVAR